jgi:ubiquinone/menaquinone biosynthesis C-methylase UbiE
LTRARASASFSRQTLEFVGNRGAVVALDASGDRLRYGSSLAPQDAGEGVRLVQGKIEATPFCNAFDLGLCRFVPEYVHEPELVVRELRRVIKPNGRLVPIDLENYPTDSRGMERLVEALAGYFDPLIGPKPYHYLRQAGFHRVDLTLRPSIPPLRRIHSHGGASQLGGQVRDHSPAWSPNLRE